MSVSAEILNERLEDMLMDDGTATWVKFLSVSEPIWLIEIVFPMHEEKKLFGSLNSLAPTFRRTIGSDYRLNLRTILYHLAYERFAPLSPSAEVIVASVIRNLDQPHRFDLKKNGRFRLDYDVDVVLVGPPRYDLDSMRTKVEDAARSFNDGSRYLGIRNLRLGRTPSRFVKAGELHSLEEIKIRRAGG